MTVRENLAPEEMSSEELEELLRLELGQQDPALALRVLEVLSRRRREDPRETAAAWQRFEKHYLPAADSVLYTEEAEAPPARKKGACGPGRCRWPRCWRWRWGCWPCRPAAAIR